jgi:hypothetical protein
VWNWPPEQRVDNLFTDFINCFLKLKLVGSGFPRDNMTQAEKHAYAKELSERECVDVQWDEIEENPGIRALGKQVLNGLWGKLCQSLDKEKTAYVSKPNEYFEMLMDDTKTVRSVRRVNDKMIEVVYKVPEELSDPHPFVNHVLAAFVTSYARMRLYEFVEPVGRNLLYVDTDSCSFVTGPGLHDVVTSPYLGDMSCEIKASHKVEDTIKTWVSVGPKSYGYQLLANADVQVVKCKGITLNYTTKKDINMKFMLRLVRNAERRGELCEVVYPNQMKKDRKRLRISRVCLRKTFGYTFNKRLLDESDYTTLPIGYRNKLID